MRNGFYFKNKHSNDFEWLYKRSHVRLNRKWKYRHNDSPYIDGEYDFSTANAYNREFYKNRVFKMNLQISAADMSELNSKITKITTWLMGRGELIFDDTPNVKWNASVIETIDYNPKTTATKRSFRCRSRCRRGRRWYLIFLTVRYWIAKTSN